MASFRQGGPLHPLMPSVPDVTFKVHDIEEAIKDQVVILEPYYPFERFKVAVIETEAAPVQFIETDLSEEEICGDSKKNPLFTLTNHNLSTNNWRIRPVKKISHRRIW